MPLYCTLSFAGIGSNNMAYVLSGLILVSAIAATLPVSPVFYSEIGRGSLLEAGTSLLLGIPGCVQGLCTLVGDVMDAVWFWEFWGTTGYWERSIAGLLHLAAHACITHCMQSSALVVHGRYCM